MAPRFELFTRPVVAPMAAPVTGAIGGLGVDGQEAIGDRRDIELGYELGGVVRVHIRHCGRAPSRLDRDWLPASEDGRVMGA